MREIIEEWELNTPATQAAHLAPVHVMLMGGTIVMGEDAQGALKPMYDMRHLVTAMILRDRLRAQGQDDAACNKALKAVTALKLGEMPEDVVDASLLKLLTQHRVRTQGTWSNVFEDQGIHPDVLQPFAVPSLREETTKARGLLDSIDFDIRTHTAEVMEGLQQRFTEDFQPVLALGGTDTAEFYAPYLTAQAYLGNVSVANRQLGFLTAMRSFEEDPSHVADILRTSLKTMRRLQQQRYGGGVFLSPELDAQGALTAMRAQDVFSGIEKISSRLPDAFRSDAPPVLTVPAQRVAVTRLADFAPKPAAASCLSVWAPEKGGDVRVFPPLLAGTSAKAAGGFLQAVADKTTKGAVILLEYDAALFADQAQLPFLQHAIKQASAQGMRVLVVTKEKDITPEHHAQLVPHGAEIMVAVSTPLAWVQAHFMGDSAPPSTTAADQVSAREEVLKPFKPARSIGLRYVPDTEAFALAMDAALAVLAPQQGARHIIIEALPGFALPEQVQATVQKALDAGVHVQLASPFAGAHYHLPDGTAFIEGEQKAAYAASGWVAKQPGIRILGAQPARTALAANPSQSAIVGLS